MSAEKSLPVFKNPAALAGTRLPPSVGGSAPLLAVFPAPASQQRVSESGLAGTPRNKVSLKPGRSLMDWVRLAKSGRDMTGLRGRLLHVTEAELARHNLRDDCWTCIRGLVYNVTAYMEYHPGGEEELMKAAGVDGTELFEQVHRWVNFESMLKECLVGRMAISLPIPKDVKKQKDHIVCDIVKGDNNVEAQGSEALTPLILAVPQTPTPRFDWFQTEFSVSLVVYSKQKDLEPECVVVDVSDRELRVCVVLGDQSYLLHLELEDKVLEEYTVQVTSPLGKVEVCLKKAQPRMSWKSLGQHLGGSGLLDKTSSRELLFRRGVVTARSTVTHDTVLLCVRLPPGTHMGLALGHHVYLQAPVQGVDITRAYTPVLPSLTAPWEVVPRLSTLLHFMIKVYPNGTLTPVLGCLGPGDAVLVGDGAGTFRRAQVAGVSQLSLIAAGTGLTPMVRLLAYAVVSDHIRKIELVFFNKSPEDILWKQQIDELCDRDSRFQVHYVLSEVSDRWHGRIGRISRTLLSELLAPVSSGVGERRRRLACVCGAAPFTELAVSILDELGFEDQEIHTFTE
ncbi:cytochrome b5 reductase 4 [Petromyzon marinus]|uniref:cytochrome b5 reductase 4 n=1 Tax=Petromyzon marinus TaxID=7757 RepID=UPI003F7156D9